MIDADGVGVGKNQLGQGRDGVGQQLIKPPDSLGFPRPEVLIGVGRDFLFVHHLPGTPGVVLPGGIQLAGDGAVHLAVVAYIDDRLRRELFRAHHLYFGVNRPNSRFDHPVQGGSFPFFHRLASFPFLAGQKDSAKI